MRSSHSHHAVGFALALACAAQAATYEVAQQNPQASDDGPGTTDQPWKTIARAADKVGPADVVVIHGGVYRERVVAKSNGTPQAPIRFEAAPGEHVMLWKATMCNCADCASATPPTWLSTAPSCWPAVTTQWKTA